jgi:hypothetical protein
VGAIDTGAILIGAAALYRALPPLLAAVEAAHVTLREVRRHPAALTRRHLTAPPASQRPGHTPERRSARRARRRPRAVSARA